MAKGILFVETRPSSPELEAEYHEWYERHMRELVAVDGVLSARRFAPLGDDDRPFVAIYEIEADDIPAVQRRLVEALGRGEITVSPALQTDPPSTFVLYEQLSDYHPAAESGT